MFSIVKFMINEPLTRRLPIDRLLFLIQETIKVVCFIFMAGKTRNGAFLTTILKFWGIFDNYFAIRGSFGDSPMKILLRRTR